MGIRLLVPVHGRSLVFCKAAWQSLQILSFQTWRAKDCTCWAALLPESLSNCVCVNCSELWQSLHGLRGGSQCSCIGNRSSFFPSSTAALQQFFDQLLSTHFQEAGDCMGLENETEAKSQYRASTWWTRQCDVQNTDPVTFISTAKTVKRAFFLRLFPALSHYFAASSLCGASRFNSFPSYCFGFLNTN